MTEPVGVPLPGATAVTVAVKVTDWPKTEGLTKSDDARRGGLVDDLGQVAEVLGREIGVAAVDGGDRVASRSAAPGGEARCPVAERGRAERRLAVVERDGAGRRAAAGRGGRHGRREGHGLVVDRRIVAETTTSSCSPC